MYRGQILHCSLLREVRRELIVDEDFLVEGSGQTFLGQPDELALVLRKSNPGLQLVRGYDVGTLVALVVLQKLLENEAEVRAGYDVDVREEHVIALAVLARQVSHVILRVHVADSPAALIARHAAHHLVQGTLGLTAVQEVRQWVVAWLLLGRPILGHCQRKKDTLADGFVAATHVLQVLLQNFKLLVTSDEEPDAQWSGPLVHDLDQRVKLLEGALSGQADLGRLGELDESRASHDGVESTVETPRVPATEPDVQVQRARVVHQREFLGGTGRRRGRWIEFL